MSNACERIDQTDRDVSQITSEVGSLRLQTDKIVQIKGHFQRTLAWLARLRERWLIVIDNADTDTISGNLKELALGTWKRDTRGHFIITTRREPLAVAETFHIDKNNCNYLETLSEEEGVQFMIKRTEMSDECSIGSISKLVNELGGLPLALEQAAAHIKCLQCSFKHYLAKFEKKRLKYNKEHKSSV
ncbi:unnamed protein product [Mytilus edulis]|uniref:NB-ARC domain-containing protein n=1 Tax=Mytilus edulis TaxID=6550 RepID=A0A8S3RAU4_MYTED|nr:unnamed protein product [Mytilus edulis]